MAFQKDNLSPARILFISPLGGFNGAEKVLQTLVSHLPSNVQCEVYFGKNGDIIPSMSDSCPVHVRYSEQSKIKYIFQRLLKYLIGIDLDKRHLLTISRKFNPKFWYFNTFIQFDLMSLCQTTGIPLVIHFHELPSMFMKMTAKQLESMVHSANLLIGCSSEVSENLKIMGGQNVRTVHEFIDTNNILIGNNTNTIRSKLKIPENNFIWLMSGGPDYRKGVDFIPEIAESIEGKGDIIWVGPGNSGIRYFVESKLSAKGLKNVHFLGEKRHDYYDFMNVCNGFLLTSREDPFPLVMIEAAALGKPIVSFDSGGASEFLLPNMGIVVDNYDVKAYHKAMDSIMSNAYDFKPEVSISRAREFDVRKRIDSWLSAVNPLLKDN